MRSAIVAAVAAFAGLCDPAAAQTWPSKPIRAVIPLTAGSATDVVARMVLDQVSKQLGQPFVVENRGGAAGTIGTNAVAKAEPNGYTILVNSSSHTVFRATFINPGFDVLTDFAAIAPLASIPTVLVVNPSKGYKSIQDFVATAKAKPGELNFASAGIGNSTHLAAERFNSSAGIKAQHIPFKGAPEAIAEVMGGRVDYYVPPVAAAMSLIKDGKLQALGIGSARRSSVLPNLPTTIEAGFAESNYEFWIGAFVARATPHDIVERLAKEFAAALKDNTVKAKLAALGADPMPMTPREFETYLANEIELNVKLAKSAGIAPH